MAVKKETAIPGTIRTFRPRLFAPLVFKDEMIVPVGFPGPEVAEAFPGYLEDAVPDHGDILSPGAEGVLLAEMEDPVLEGRVGQEIDFPVRGLGGREGKG